MSQTYTHLLPLNDNVIIEPVAEPKEKIVGGLIIPQTVGKENQTSGKVIAHGAGRFEFGFRVPMTVKVGDEVIFNPYAANKIEIGGVTLFMMLEREISCVVKKPVAAPTTN